MHVEATLSARKLLLATALTLLLSLLSVSARAQDDPPMEAGRISFASGTVSLQPAGLDSWGQAQVNLPFGPGDRIYTDSDGRAEIQIGETYIRIGPNSDVSMVNDTPDDISIGVGQGSIHIHTRALWPNQVFHINTPSGTASINTSSEMRIDVLSDQSAAVFTAITNYTVIEGAGGFREGISQGQSLELAGTNPVVPQYLTPAAFDDLDYWSQQRDQRIASAESWRYISPEIPGGEELDANGSWMPGTPYGAVWFPNVAAGWAPYHYGRWVNHAPWGPVWVEDEPWGYAPFHYGRWVTFQGRWGWVPGPRAVHPVWSPALVVFAGGGQVGGAAISAWFPLGPGEPYRPWYPCSPHYIDQVNITNMSEGPHVHVLTTYVGFNFGGIAFAYRQTGFTAVRQADFAAGRPVRETNVVVNVNVIQHVTIIERPVVQVDERVLVSRPPSRPVPVAAARPTLINERGMVVSARPGFHPVAAPVRPAPQVRNLPGRRAVAPPPGSHVPPPSGINAHPAPPPNRTSTQPEGRQPASSESTGSHPNPAGSTQQPSRTATQSGDHQTEPSMQQDHPANNTHQAPAKPAADQETRPGQPQNHPGARQGDKQDNPHGGKQDKNKDEKKDQKSDDK